MLAHVDPFCPLLTRVLAGLTTVTRASARATHRASASHLGLSRVPYVVYGIKYIDLVFLDYLQAARARCNPS